MSNIVEVVNFPSVNAVRNFNAAAMHAPHTEALTEQDQQSSNVDRRTSAVEGMGTH